MREACFTKDKEQSKAGYQPKTWFHMFFEGLQCLRLLEKKTMKTKAGGVREKESGTEAVAIAADKASQALVGLNIAHV